MVSDTFQDDIKECFSSAAIAERISALAQTLNQKFAEQYPNEPVLALCILRGAFMFFSDLVRQLTIPHLQLDFIGLSSYHDAAVSSGSVAVTQWLSLDASDAHLIIVEDIVDTGKSMQVLLEKLRALAPRSITLCALLDKREKRVCDVPLDYSCFQVGEGFFVGYGLDFAQRYRHLPGIYTLTPKTHTPTTHKK